MGFDVPAILGDHVTLDAGTGAVHTAPGHGPDDYVIGQKYGLETANPVGPDGTYLPGTYPTLDGVNVFKANDIVVALLQEKARCCTFEKMQHQLSKAAGVTKRRSSSARRRSGSSKMDQERSACAVTERDQRRAVDPGPAARVDGCANCPDWCISRVSALRVPMSLFA